MAAVTCFLLYLCKLHYMLSRDDSTDGLAAPFAIDYVKKLV